MVASVGHLFSRELRFDGSSYAEGGRQKSLPNMFRFQFSEPVTILHYMTKGTKVADAVKVAYQLTLREGD